MSTEDMIEILVAERDRALREVMSLTRQRDEALAHVEEQHQESLRLIEGLNVAHRERDEARAEVEHMRRGIEAYRRLVSVHRVELHGVNTHQTITNNNHASAVWLWEAEQ